MRDERMTCKAETSKGERNNNPAEKDSGNKGKKKEFTTKEHRDKNIIRINTKLDHNEIVLSS